MLTSRDTAGATSPSQATAPVAAILVIWFALVLFLGVRGEFVGRPGTPPLPLLVSFLIPLIAFSVGYRAIGSFRDFVLTLDLRLVAGIQAWRFIGIGFIALAVYRVLPGAFAWRAGLGDIAIGVTAPLVLLALIRRPGFAGTPLFVGWNVLGMLDLMGGMISAAMSAILAKGGAGGVTIGPMAQMPLVLIPAFFVPLFYILHLAALFQARQRRVAARTTAQPAHEPHLAA